MSSLRILIAEDHPDQRTLLVHVVRRLYADATITAVNDGDAALTHYQTHGADVIITDQHMPGLMGSALIQQVRTANPSIAVILLSGLITNGMTAPDGHTFYVQKPVDLRTLARVLHQALAVAAFV